MTVPTDRRLRHVAEKLGACLRAENIRLAVAESCTGGWIAKMITDVAGSSEWFDCGLVTYNNAAKCVFLGVSRETLDAYGAVSRETALEMVKGVLMHSMADIAVAVTGIAGPAGGTADKPVGTVWIAWARREGDVRSQVFHFAGDRDAVRRQTVVEALCGVAALLG
ncbi:MAG: CinA family protein [Xanthomonadaceae bacterium]|jgi:nicotinamide-nucleotide amidase|nr:CinA family protein [Xanthomonadaceae bacterium]